MAAIPAFKYCSWYSKAYGNTTDETDLKWHSNLSSLSEAFVLGHWHSWLSFTRIPHLLPPGRTAPKQRSICTFYKNITRFIPPTPLSKLSFQLLCAAQHRFLQVYPMVLERNVEPAPHTYTRVHRTQAKPHRAGGGVGSVSGTQPQGYNGKAKSNRTCGLLNILLDFATSCQFQCTGKGTQYHRFLSKSMAQPDYGPNEHFSFITFS